MQALIKKLQIEIKEKDLRIQRLQNVIKEYTELTFEKDAEIQRLRDVIQNQSGKLKIKKENIEKQVNSEKRKVFMQGSCCFFFSIQIFAS